MQYDPFRLWSAARLVTLLAVMLASLAACGGDDETIKPSGTTTSSTSSSSSSGAGGGGGGPATGPIDAPEKEWTWVPFDNAFCGDGSPTGLGINLSGASKDVIVYLQGGGFCYNDGTCLGPDATASHFDGFGDTEFGEFTSAFGVQGIFDRTDAKNPFKDHNYVFVPYCTGDLHAGNKISAGLHFVGHANLEGFLERVVPTFPDAKQVVLAGSSAGGMGTLYNFYAVQTAFGDIPATYIDDAGPLPPFSYVQQLALVIGIWGLKDTIPPGCDTCLQVTGTDVGPHNLIPYYATKFPGHRGSLVCSLQDETISGFLSLTGDKVAEMLNSIADAQATNPDFRVYYLDDTRHVWLNGDAAAHKLSGVVSAGTSLDTFISQQISGDAAWANVRP